MERRKLSQNRRNKNINEIFFENFNLSRDIKLNINDISIQAENYQCTT